MNATQKIVAAKPDVPAVQQQPIARKAGRRSDIDWEAVERDYRIDKHTNRQLCTKYGIADSGLRKRAKEKGWQKDLTHAVCVATKAALIAEKLARAEIIGAQIGAQIGAKLADATVESVKLAVRDNVAIIGRHQQMHERHMGLLQRAEDKVTQMVDDITDIREAKVLVDAVGTLASAGRSLMDQERKSHNIDDTKVEESVEDLIQEAMAKHQGELS